MPLSLRHVLSGLVALSLPTTFMLVSTPVAAAPSYSSADATSVEVAAASKKRKKRNLKVRSLPQIAQPGAKAANANRARSVFTGTLRPGGKGHTVVVQIRNGKKWKQVARGKTVAKGAFHVTAPARKGKKYRVVAPRNKQLRKATSKVVRIDQWLKPTFQDQFNGKKLGKRWVVRGQVRQPLSKRGCSKGDRRAMNVGKGTLRLTVRKDPDTKKKCTGMRDGKPAGKHSYRLNGHVGTDGTWSFRYGFAAARMKMHKARGQHSSFWLQPDTPGRIPTAQWGGAEVDIIEYMGAPHSQGGITHSLYAYNKKGEFESRGGWLKKSRQYLNGPKDGWSKNYHVFSVEWTPNQYIFRIDGKESWRTNFGVSQVPQYVILSNLSSDYELHLLGNEKKLPQHTHVDWVRVWELPRP